jgi:acetyl-CoA carboxylase biotin carboxyl carrier protein
VGEKLTTEDVKTILSLLEASAFDELKLETGEFKLSIRKSSAPEFDPAPSPVLAKPAVPVAPDKPSPGVAVASGSSTPVKSPTFGVFYRAPKPGAAPFVEIGAEVEHDTIIGIVEVMKLMNSVAAEVSGQVVEIVAADGEVVEFGQTLLYVRPR